MDTIPHVTLVYDYECPACDHYCRMLRIRKSAGELKLVNAREDNELVAEITANGWDIDQGMVVIINDNWYYGSDAIHVLALMSSRSGLFNQVNYWIFRSKSLSALFYPVLRSLRNLLLKILGKRKINNLGIRGNDRF